MGTGTIALATDLKPAAVDPHQRQCRPRFDLWFELASLKICHVLIAIGLQLLTKLMGNPAGLPTTDGYLGELFQSCGRFLKRGLTGAGTNDLAENRRAIPV